MAVGAQVIELPELTTSRGLKQTLGPHGLLAELPLGYQREAVEAAVQTFLQSGYAGARYIMYKTVEDFLRRYHLARMVFPDFVVERLKKGGIRIFARRLATGRHCPDCGSYIYNKDPVRLVNIKGTGRSDDNGWYTYGCACGAIFRRKEGDEA